jgi:hypothetical protein
MAYGLDLRGSIAGRGKILIFSITFRPALGPIQPGALSPGVKKQRLEIDQSLPSSAAVKNGGAYTFSSLITSAVSLSLHGM